MGNVLQELLREVVRYKENRLKGKGTAGRSGGGSSTQGAGQPAEDLARLEDIGFRRVGNWQLVLGKPVRQLESEARKQDVLYAFVSRRQVLYVGKTTQALDKRMYGYQKPGAGQRTNLAVNAKIAETLATRSVDIFALADTGSQRRGSFVISLTASLEDAIIRELSPPWNKMGVKPR